MRKEQDTIKKKKGNFSDLKKTYKRKISNFYHSQQEMYDLSEKSAWAGTALVREAKKLTVHLIAP